MTASSYMPILFCKNTGHYLLHLTSVKRAMLSAAFKQYYDAYGALATFLQKIKLNYKSEFREEPSRCCCAFPVV
jgi:hypothetical protein